LLSYGRWRTPRADAACLSPRGDCHRITISSRKQPIFLPLTLALDRDTIKRADELAVRFAEHALQAPDTHHANDRGQATHAENEQQRTCYCDDVQ
jgi:hypothetical protein